MEEPSAHHIPSFSFSVSCSLEGLPQQIICLHQSASCPPSLHHEPSLSSFSFPLSVMSEPPTLLYLQPAQPWLSLWYARLHAGHPQWTSQHLQSCYLQPRLLSFKQTSPFALAVTLVSTHSTLPALSSPFLWAVRYFQYLSPHFKSGQIGFFFF